MLNARYSENTFLTTPALVVALRLVKDENEVKRTIPALQPVATILTGEGGYEGGRPHAFVYPLPDGTLIRLRFNGNNTYNYESATAIPSTHPAAKAYAKNPNHEIELLVAEEGDLGPRANPADVAKLKDRLEADTRRYLQEQANERRLKL
ncbi:MAG: hypothetical protein WC612_02075 [Bdellovibrionales bacterium]|jgi:hypothetical protein